ncbi:MAG: YqgE/AlgH family protein [Alphaproteobacteria bacterium]|nr:YqgE/AlgH family protein [Alphaproteobacteria bacterium]
MIKTTEQPDRDAWLTGKLLLAMPGMADPRFHKAVICLCAHDSGGAMGLVINHRLKGMDMSGILKQVDMAASHETAQNMPVMQGGPVETARGFLLHSHDFILPETICTGDALCVTGTLDALRAVAAGKGPQQMIFALGYAGWTAGQLEQELQQNAWLCMDADPALVFETPPEQKWDAALATLGVDQAMLSVESGRA